MPQYEVVIIYKGQESFFVEADDADKADEIASDKFKNGESGTPTGAEYEHIENTVVRLVR